MNDASGSAKRTADVFTVQSRYDFAETVVRLTHAIETAGAVLFTTIDQQDAAAKVGLDLRPTTALIFGNPTVGTRLMQSLPIAGLDLPLKMLVWEEGGVVNVSYARVRDFSESSNVTSEGSPLAAMDRALANLASAVAGET